MLVLSRQKDESVIIDGGIEVTIVDIRGDKVRLGFTAPKSVGIHRKEIYQTPKLDETLAATEAALRKEPA